MRPRTGIFILAVLGAFGPAAQAAEPVAHGAPDPRLREVLYDGHSVITINVRRGVVTEIDLEPTESVAFAATGYGSDCEAKERFGFFLDALEYGTPPHGGIALGLDRIVMILAGASSLREVIAFPKTAKAIDLMVDAPTPVSEQQLRELHLRIVSRS